MSEVNQNTVKDFVDREVYSNVTDMVQDLIETDKIDLFEYLTPKCIYEGEEYTQEEIDKIIEDLDEKIDQLNDELHETISEEQEIEIEEKISQMEEKIEELGDLDFDEYPEPLEYWIVSPFLAEKLKDRGEVIIDEYMAPIWGRETSGQAILLDSVIVDIVKSLDIY